LLVKSHTFGAWSQYHIAGILVIHFLSKSLLDRIVAVSCLDLACSHSCNFFAFAFHVAKFVLGALSFISVTFCLATSHLLVATNSVPLFHTFGISTFSGNDIIFIHGFRLVLLFFTIGTHLFSHFSTLGLLLFILYNHCDILGITASIPFLAHIAIAGTIIDCHGVNIAHIPISCSDIKLFLFSCDSLLINQLRIVTAFLISVFACLMSNQFAFATSSSSLYIHSLYHAMILSSKSVTLPLELYSLCHTIESKSLFIAFNSVGW
jgi:hypothetical protein